MGTVTIRNLDDDVIERAKQRAKSHHRSLEAELRTILTRELKPLLRNSRAARHRAWTSRACGWTSPARSAASPFATAW